MKRTFRANFTAKARLREPRASRVATGAAFQPTKVREGSLPGQSFQLAAFPWARMLLLPCASKITSHLQVQLRPCHQPPTRRNFGKCRTLPAGLLTWCQAGFFAWLGTVAFCFNVSASVESQSCQSPSQGIPMSPMRVGYACFAGSLNKKSFMIYRSKLCKLSTSGASFQEGARPQRP